MESEGKERRRLVAVTLDGFIAGPDGGDPSGSDFLPVTPDLVQHLVTSWPETLPGPARDAMGISGAGQHFDTVVEVMPGTGFTTTVRRSTIGDSGRNRSDG